MNTINPERCVNTMELLNILIDPKYQGHFNSKKELKKAFKDKIEFIIKDDKSSRKIEDLKKIIDYYVKNRNKLGWIKSGIIKNNWMENNLSIKILNDAMDDLLNKYKKHDDSESETESTISIENDSIERMIRDVGFKDIGFKGNPRRRKKSKRKRKTNGASNKKKSNKKKSRRKRKTNGVSNKKKRNLKKKKHK